MNMLLVDFLSILIPIFISISISSPTVLPQILTVLLPKSNSESNAGCSPIQYWILKVIKEPILGPKRRVGFQIVKVYQVHKQTAECGKNDRIRQTRHRPIKCVKGSVAEDAKCREVDRERKEETPCILHKQKNIKLGKTRHPIQLPQTLKAGMKLTIYGGRSYGGAFTQLTITKDTEHPQNPVSWVHVCPRWNQKTVSVTDGFRSLFYQGSFPISDPDHFSIALELTKNETKVWR